MRIFVTGATGFVGRNFLSWLLREQSDVSITCLVRDADKAAAQWPETPSNLKWLAGDLLEPKPYVTELREAERVFHLAALVSLKNGPEFYRMNTDATRCLVDVLKTSDRLERLVSLSSISAVDRPLDRPAISPLTEASTPQPNTDYGKSKLLADELVAASGLPYSILRPSYIYGPYPRLQSSMDRLIHDVHRQRHYTRFPFTGRASEVYVEDLAEMIWLAGEHPAARDALFFVGNRTPVSIAQVYRDLSVVLQVPYAPMPVAFEDIDRYRRYLYRYQPENLMLRILFEDFFACDTAKWYAATGYQPTYGYEEGMARTVHWYRAQGLL